MKGRITHINFVDNAKWVMHWDELQIFKNKFTQLLDAHLQEVPDSFACPDQLGQENITFKKNLKHS